MPVDKFGRMSDAKTRDTGVSLTYINKYYIRSDGSTPVSGSINMNGNTLYNVSDPVNPQDVTTKEYADTTNKAFVLYESKYLAVGDLSMGGRRLNNVGMPIENHQASNYEFSFGNGSSGSEHAYGGYCMSASGRIIRGSLTATEARNILSKEVKVNSVVDGKEQV